MQQASTFERRPTVRYVQVKILRARTQRGTPISYIESTQYLDEACIEYVDRYLQQRSQTVGCSQPSGLMTHLARYL